MGFELVLSMGGVPSLRQLTMLYVFMLICRVYAT